MKRWRTLSGSNIERIGLPDGRTQKRFRGNVRQRKAWTVSLERRVNAAVPGSHVEVDIPSV
jgi:hypothetical protein